MANDPRGAGDLDGSAEGAPGRMLQRLTGASPTELERHLLALVGHAPGMVFLKDAQYRYLYANHNMRRHGRFKLEDLIGRTDHEVMAREIADKIHVQEAAVMASGKAQEFEETLPYFEEERHYLSLKFPTYDESGALLGLGGIISDISVRKRREAEVLAEHQRIIEAQRDTLRELSTPLLPIAEGVLAMPLVGTLGPRRSQELLDTLLHGITKQRARIAILDVTGIRELDVEVAGALVTAARAARLVGAEVVLTGISPTVARTLVSLGTDLSGIKTLATLASGIAFALRR